MHTPSTLDILLKWLATAILIVGTVVNSAKIYPLGVIHLILGGLVWLVVSIRWREPSLIVVNAVMTLAAFLGLAWEYWLKNFF